MQTDISCSLCIGGYSETHIEQFTAVLREVGAMVGPKVKTPNMTCVLLRSKCAYSAVPSRKVAFTSFQMTSASQVFRFVPSP